MDEEVGRHRSISDSLKMELQSLKERLLLVENLPQNADSESMSVQTGEKISRLELPSFPWFIYSLILSTVSVNIEII